jgi:hypothetical protein
MTPAAAYSAGVAPGRAFRPATVAAVRGSWLAVDEIQPVAVALGPDGEVLDVASWNDVAPPPQIGWPTRWLVTDGSGAAWVRDEPAGPGVRLEVTPAGALAVEQQAPPAPGPGVTRAYARLGLSRELTGACASWGFRSRLIGSRWEAEAQRSGPGGERSWSLGAGAVSSCAVTATAAAACVSRATKRPWTFRPARDLVVVGVDGGPRVVLRHGDLDVADRCWPAPSGDRVRAALAEYLPFSVAEARTAVLAGAEDVELHVRGFAGLPEIETSFRWRGSRYTRVDEPLDELGRSAGFRFLNIDLHEDMTSSDLFGPGPAGAAIRV